MKLINLFGTLSVFTFSTMGSIAFAAPVKPLTPTSSYACREGSVQDTLVVRRGSGYRTTSFPAAQSSLTSKIANAKSKKSTLQAITKKLNRSMPLSVTEKKNIQKIFAALAVSNFDVSSSVDSQTASIANIVTILANTIGESEAESRALKSCRSNKFSYTQKYLAERTVVYTASKIKSEFNFYVYYSFTDPARVDTDAFCFKQYEGKDAGKWSLRNFIPNSCKFPSSLTVYNCPQFSAATKSVLIQISSYLDYDSLQEVLDRGLQSVSDATPVELEINTVPRSGRCSDYNKS